MSNILIIGAGIAGQLLLKELLVNSENRVVGFIDDHKNEAVLGLQIIGKIDQLPQILSVYAIDQIIVAMPSQKGELIRKIVGHLLENNSVKLFILPSTADVVINAKVDLQTVRPIEPSDLVGEPVVKSEQEKIKKQFLGKNVLITGGGGSIGSELVRQIAFSGPNKVVVLDSCERNLFYIQTEISRSAPDVFKRSKFILGDVTNEPLIDEIFNKLSIDIVFHAAAYKHVPLVEENTYEGVKNNVLGTWVVSTAAKKYGVSKFILISTDKAVNPKNVMGMTKRIAEHVVSCCNTPEKKTFRAVRFGNVFNSSGSAVEIFLQQIKQHQEITITDFRMTRFFMTIPEAVHLVLQGAFSQKNNSDVYMLEMGEEVNIYELAKCLIVISGDKVSSHIFKEVGIRNGEKYSEELFDAKKEIATKSTHPRIKQIHYQMAVDTQYFAQKITDLQATLDDKMVKNHSKQGEKKLKAHLSELL